MFVRSHISLPNSSESRLPEFPTNVRKVLGVKEMVMQQMYSVNGGLKNVEVQKEHKECQITRL